MSRNATMSITSPWDQAAIPSLLPTRSGIRWIKLIHTTGGVLIFLLNAVRGSAPESGRSALANPPLRSRVGEARMWREEQEPICERIGNRDEDITLLPVSTEACKPCPQLPHLLWRALSFSVVWFKSPLSSGREGHDCCQRNDNSTFATMGNQGAWRQPPVCLSGWSFQNVTTLIVSRFTDVYIQSKGTS